MLKWLISPAGQLLTSLLAEKGIPLAEKWLGNSKRGGRLPPLTLNLTINSTSRDARRARKERKERIARSHQESKERMKK